MAASFYNPYGYEVLDRTLRHTLATWEGENKKHLNMAKLFRNGKKKDAPEDMEDYPERE